jgi:hypothetical protein
MVNYLARRQRQQRFVTSGRAAKARIALEKGAAPSPVPLTGAQRTKRYRDKLRHLVLFEAMETDRRDALSERDFEGALHQVKAKYELGSRLWPWAFPKR